MDFIPSDKIINILPIQKPIPCTVVIQCCTLSTYSMHMQNTEDIRVAILFTKCAPGGKRGGVGKDDLEEYFKIRLAFVRLGLHVRAIAIVHQILQQVCLLRFLLC